MTPLSWEKWVQRYEGKGYRVLAPAYSGFEVEVKALREDASPIEALTFPAIIEHIGGVIDELDKPPIIIGRSAWGLLAQILLDHGYEAAGVAIDSVLSRGAQSLFIGVRGRCILRSWPYSTPERLMLRSSNTVHKRTPPIPWRFGPRPHTHGLAFRFSCRVATLVA